MIIMKSSTYSSFHLRDYIIWFIDYFLFIQFEVKQIKFYMSRAKIKDPNDSKSSKLKDQFSFDSRQTKFIGKRTGKLMAYANPSKSKHGIFPQFQFLSDQEQQAVQNQTKLQSQSLSKQNQRKIKVNRSKQYINDQQKYEHQSKTLSTIVSKIQQKQQRKKQQYDQKQYAQKQQTQKQQDQKQQKTFQFQFDQNQLKRNRSEDYLNQSLSNIEQQQQKVEKQKKIEKQKTDPNYQPQQQSNQISKKEIIKKVVKLGNKNSPQRLKQEKQIPKKQQVKMVKKKLNNKPIRNGFNDKLSLNKPTKSKQMQLTQILGKQNNSNISNSSIRFHAKSKLIGSITFNPKTKVQFKGFSNTFSHAIIKCVNDSNNTKAKQHIVLKYLGTQRDLKVVINVENNFPFSIQNISGKKVQVSFTLFKQEEECKFQ